MTDSMTKSADNLRFFGLKLLAAVAKSARKQRDRAEARDALTLQITFHVWALTGLQRPWAPKWKALHRRIGRSLFARNPETATRVAESFVRHGYTHRLTLVINTFTQLGQTNELVRVRRAQVERSPREILPRILLAQALSVDTSLGLYNDPKIGLVAQGIGRRPEAIDELQIALEFAPNDPGLHFEIGSLLLQLGLTPAAIFHLQASLDARPRAEVAFRLGTALQRPDISDFEGASSAYRLALEIDPETLGAAASLSSVSVRTECWDGWDFLISQQKRYPDHRRDTLFTKFEDYFRTPRLETDVSNLVAQLRDYVRVGGPFDVELVRSIAARLQSLGRFTLAFEVKDLLARRSLHATLEMGESINALHTRSQALAYLSRAGEILEMYQPLPWEPRGRKESMFMNKIAADAAFTMGDPTPLIEYERKNPPGLPLPANETMGELVRGKRVAIVGPSFSIELDGGEIDGFDTVIRPRFTREFVRANAAISGARTDISYYSSTDIGALKFEVKDAAERGDIQLAVLRPMLYAALSGKSRETPWMRFYRHDYSLFFLGSPLGITRILYDVVPFEPAEIRIFNVDLYTGTKAFAKGYRQPKDEQLAADSILNDLFRAHDLRAEFDLMRALFLNGVFTANDMTADILNLSTAAYLQRLERSTAFRG